MFQHYLSLLLALALVSWAHGFVPGFLSLQPARHSHPIRRACNFKSLRIAINAEQDSADLEWWEQLGGLPFECTQCGKCCHVKGDVWFSPEETNRILGFLGISEKTFKEKYVNEEIEGWNRVHRVKGNDDPTFTIVSPDADDEGRCIFVNEDKTCSIYEARPMHCRVYPFFPKILGSVESWNEHVVLSDEEANKHDGNNKKVWTKSKGGCEGMKEVLSTDSAAIEKDKMVSADDIRELLMDYEDTYCMFPEDPWRWFV